MHAFCLLLQCRLWLLVLVARRGARGKPPTLSQVLAPLLVQLPVAPFLFPLLPLREPSRDMSSSWMAVGWDTTGTRRRPRLEACLVRRRVRCSLPLLPICLLLFGRAPMWVTRLLKFWELSG